MFLEVADCKQGKCWYPGSCARVQQCMKPTCSYLEMSDEHRMLWLREAMDEKKEQQK